MAARMRRITLSDDWKERIRVGEILSRLVRHFEGKCEMSATQIAAAKLVLSKVVPDLRAVDQILDARTPHYVINAQPELTIEEWQENHGLPTGNGRSGEKSR